MLWRAVYLHFHRSDMIGAALFEHYGKSARKGEKCALSHTHTALKRLWFTFRCSPVSSFRRPDDMMSSGVIFPFLFYYVPFSGFLSFPSIQSILFLFFSLLRFCFTRAALYDVWVVRTIVACIHSLRFLSHSKFDSQMLSHRSVSFFVLSRLLQHMMCVCARTYMWECAQHSIHNRSSDVTDVPFLDKDDDCLSRRFRMVKRKESTTKIM